MIKFERIATVLPVIHYLDVNFSCFTGLQVFTRDPR